jgi:hypothetical protein
MESDPRVWADLLNLAFLNPKREMGADKSIMHSQFDRTRQNCRQGNEQAVPDNDGLMPSPREHKHASPFAMFGADPQAQKLAGRAYCAATHNRPLPLARDQFLRQRPGVVD